MNHSNKTAHGCLKILALPVVLGFIITAVLAALLASLAFTFANRASIKSAISVDAFVRTFATQAIEADIQQKHLALGLPPAQIDTPTIRYAVDLLVPPTWVDDAMDDGIDTIFDFLEAGQTDDYVLSLMPLMATFQSEAGREAMGIIIAQYPPCPASEQPEFHYDPESRNVDIACLPPDIPAAQVADQIYTALIAGLTNDPNIQASGGVERLEWPPNILADAAEIRNAFTWLSQLRWAWLVPLGVLIFLALLAVRSLYSLGVWFGSPLLISGLLAPVIGLIIVVQLADVAQSYMGEFSLGDEVLAQLATQIIFNVAASLRNIWLMSVVVQAGIMIMLGLGGLLLAFYLRLSARRKVE